MLFFGTGKNFVALDELTGATRWTFKTGGVNATSAAVSNGIVYFGTGDWRVLALNATTGASKWPSPGTTTAGVSSSPALSLGSGVLYVGSNDHYLYALNATNGSRLWRYSTSAPVFSSPAVADGRVFFGSLDNSVYALGPVVPQLQVSISPSESILRSGEISTLTTTVSNASAPVSGATINITSSGGGGFSTPVDKGNGNYTAMFNAPTQNSSPTITIQATKPGFVAGQNQVTVVISGVPDLTSIKVGGIPLIIFLASFILIAVIMIVAVAQRRKKNRSQQYKLRPSTHPARQYFSYS